MKCYIIFVIIFALYVSVNCNKPNIPPSKLKKYTNKNVSEALTALAGGKGFLQSPLFNEANTVKNPIEVDVTFWCRDRTTNRDVQLFANDTDIGAKTDRSKRYVFIIHGWLFNRNVQWVQDMVRDFIQYVPGVNVCTVDWGKLAYYEYDIAATQNVYSVGRFLEEAINKWKIRPYNVSLVGHTLGAHIAGITGKYLDDSIGKIFAIDPAGPLFCHPNVVDKRSRLTKTDAEYVQVIMTTGGFSGCGIESGIQTFRPAGGVVQPACTGPNFDTIDTEVCSHLIGTEYFRASLQESNTFTAKECESWFLYAVGLCKDAHQDKMGYYAKGLPGDFYLDIGKQEPFSLS